MSGAQPGGSSGAGGGLLRPLRFGALALRTNLFLSPLAGYTNLPFRTTLRELGGLDLCTTDLVAVRSLLRRTPAALRLVATGPDDSPLAVQLFGADAAEMRDGAQMLEALGLASVDVNMGCPVDRVVRTGSGSLLMTCPERAAAIVGAMAGAVRIPVTAKMRLGWDARSLTAPGLARALEDAGAAAVFVHGRTRAQGFGGRVDLGGIRAVVAAVRGIPVIGNGDVTSPEAARRMFEETGCAGVSIGRGAFYDPWIFARTAQLLETGAAPTSPGFEERVAVMARHLDRLVAFFGEDRGCLVFRRIAPWYTRGQGPAVAFRRAIGGLRRRAQFEEIMAAYREWRQPFLDGDGELLPRYRARPPRCSFMEPEAETGAGDGGAGIAVPRGPNAVW
jgi:nifR3 family TIM-barrel protein